MSKFWSYNEHPHLDFREPAEQKLFILLSPNSPSSENGCKCLFFAAHDSCPCSHGGYLLSFIRSSCIQGILWGQFQHNVVWGSFYYLRRWTDLVSLPRQRHRYQLHHLYKMDEHFVRHALCIMNLISMHRWCKRLLHCHSLTFWCIVCFYLVHTIWIHVLLWYDLKILNC